jgi:hypothetical protein
VVGIGAVPATAVAALMGGDMAIRWPRWNTSTVRAVTRTSTSARMSVCGTE